MKRQSLKQTSLSQNSQKKSRFSAFNTRSSDAVSNTSRSSQKSNNKTSKKHNSELNDSFNTDVFIIKLCESLKTILNGNNQHVLELLQSIDRKMSCFLKINTQAKNNATNNVKKNDVLPDVHYNNSINEENVVPENVAKNQLFTLSAKRENVVRKYARNITISESYCENLGLDDPKIPRKLTEKISPYDKEDLLAYKKQKSIFNTKHEIERMQIIAGGQKTTIDDIDKEAQILYKDNKMLEHFWLDLKNKHEDEIREFWKKKKVFFKENSTRHNIPVSYLSIIHADLINKMSSKKVESHQLSTYSSSTAGFERTTNGRSTNKNRNYITQNNRYIEEMNKNKINHKRFDQHPYRDRGISSNNSNRTFTNIQRNYASRNSQIPKTDFRSYSQVASQNLNQRSSNMSSNRPIPLIKRNDSFLERSKPRWNYQWHQNISQSNKNV